MRNAISVSRLVRYLKEKLDSDFNLSTVLIKGEISNFVAHRSGHYYFTIKDEQARLSCVMFSTYARKCPLKIADGLSVIVEGNISVYENQGSFQMYVQSIEKEGLGALFAEIEKRKAKLQDAGYFALDHKKMKPAFPMKIGVISAKEGAAIQDVLTTIKRRWPLANVHFYPSLVQGKDAPKDLIANLLVADEDNLDVILLVRGGGSIEDLWAFFDEELCITIFNLKTCIISGVGHESDTTLVDFVSDYRSPTPTAAAEEATPNIIDVNMSVEAYRSSMIRSIQNKLMQNQNQLNVLKKHPYINNPHLALHSKAEQLMLYTNRLFNYENIYKQKKHQFYMLKNDLMQSSNIISNEQKTLQAYKLTLSNQIKHIYYINRRNYEHNLALLDAYSPIKLLLKGYSLVYKNQVLIKKSEQLAVDDVLNIQLSDDIVEVKVLNKGENQ